MNEVTFIKILEDTIKNSRNTLGLKGNEYAREDRLHNFKVAARIDDTTPEKALKGMSLKHIVSVFDLISDTDKKPYKWTKEIIDEKIGDSINYLYLLKALLYERLDNQNKE